MTDRALKERIIGAVVLVLIAVLVVPIFLDGPADEQEIISESVTLPGQNSQASQQQTIVLDRDRNEPVPAADSSTRMQPASTTPAQTSQQPLSVTPAESDESELTDDANNADDGSVQAAASEPAATSATGMWAVQLGSFSNQENANRLAASLRDQGYAAFLSQLPTDSGALHRVRIGPQKDRASAEAIASQLAKTGHKGQVVTHP